MKIRAANYNDLEEIKDLCTRNGLKINKINQEIWKDLPKIKEFQDTPIGWVLETDEKKIVGVILNFFTNYTLNEKIYKAAIVSSWAVDDKYRKDSLGLFYRWLNQKNVDLLVDNRRTERSAKILKSYKFNNITTKDYEKIMYWILDYPNFIRSAIKKKIKIFVGPIIFLPAIILKLYDFVVRRNKNFYPKKNTIEVKSFDEKFDIFWNNIPKNNKFLAERDTASLKWHFGRAINKKKNSVLTLYNENNLTGYIIIMRSDNNDIGLKRMQIVDIQTLSDDKENINDLIVNAIMFARKQGVHILELVGFGQDVRHQAAKMNPYVRKLSHSPFFYKLISKELKYAFSEKIEWNASLYDGDGSLDAID